MQSHFEHVAFALWALLILAIDATRRVYHADKPVAMALSVAADGQAEAGVTSPSRQMSDNPIKKAIFGHNYPEAQEYDDKWAGKMQSKMFIRTSLFKTAYENAKRPIFYLDGLDFERPPVHAPPDKLEALSTDMAIFAHNDVTYWQRVDESCSDLCAVCAELNGELNGKAIFIDRAKSFKGKLGAIVNFSGLASQSGLLGCPRVGFSIVGARVSKQKYGNGGSYDYGLKKLRNANKDSAYREKTPEEYIQLAQNSLGTVNNGSKTVVESDYHAIAHCEHLRRRYFDMRHARECVSHSELCGVGSKALVFRCIGDAWTKMFKKERACGLGALKDVVDRHKT